MFVALRALGPRAPDIAFPYGDDSWWLNSTSGAWSSYVLEEVIPKALQVLHADPRRVAIGGISMGGSGAYAIAGLDPGRFCAVGGHSAALEPGARGESGVIAAARANPQRYGLGQLWLDVGAQDPSFTVTGEQFAHALHIPCTCGRAATTSDTGTRTGTAAVLDTGCRCVVLAVARAGH